MLVTPYAVMDSLEGYKDSDGAYDFTGDDSLIKCIRLYAIGAII